MADQTDNHEYNVPNEGETNWDVLLNENFRDYDADIPLRDTAGNRSNYTPKEDALLVATDTEELFRGDGSNWNRLTSTGSTPTLSSIGIGGDALTVGRSSRLNATEYFGVRAGTSGSEFGGIYVDAASGSGRPFYGYGSGGSGVARHLYDPSAGSSGEWRLRVGATPGLRVNPSGGVGVGTTPKTTSSLAVDDRIFVTTAGTPLINLFSSTTGSNANPVLNYGTGGALRASQRYVDAGNRWETEVINSGGDNARLSLTRGGNLGVNTDSPARALDVRGSSARVRGGGAQASMAVGAQGAGPTGRLAYEYRNYGSLVAGHAYFPNTGTWRLGVDGASKMAVTSAFVGINGAVENTSVSNDEFGVLADVSGNTFGGMYVGTTSPDGKPQYAYTADGDLGAFHHYDGADDAWRLNVRNPSSTVPDATADVSVTSGGALGVNTGTPGASLDVRGVNAQLKNGGANATLSLDVGSTGGSLSHDYRVGGSTRAFHEYDQGAGLWRLQVGKTGKVTASEDFVGVNGATEPPISNGELGVLANTNGFGGMAVETTGADGKPQYAYVNDGSRSIFHYFDGSDDTWKLSYTVDSPRIAVSRDFVGINTDTDQGLVADVFGVNAETSSAGFGGMFLETTGADSKPYYSYVTDGTQGAYHYYDADTDEWILQMGAGRVRVESDGTLNAPSKNFVESVDTDDGEREVVYTSVESDTAHTETSGTATVEDGRADVELPEHFGWVTDPDEQLTVQVTAHAEGFVQPQVTERSTRRIVVEDFTGELTGDGPPEAYEVSYTIKGTHEGHADKDVVREPTGDRRNGGQTPPESGGADAAGDRDGGEDRNDGGDGGDDADPLARNRPAGHRDDEGR